jgi:predicted RNA-binding protein YlqC (UPF0109 family)
MIDLSTVLANIAKSIVDHPDQVVVTEKAEGNEVLMTLSVAEEDMGMIIGKRGKIAKAIRTVMRTISKIDDRKVTVEIK